MEKQEKVFWHNERMYLVSAEYACGLYLFEVNSLFGRISFGNFFEVFITPEEIFQEYINPQSSMSFFTCID